MSSEQKKDSLFSVCEKFSAALPARAEQGISLCLMAYALWPVPCGRRPTACALWHAPCGLCLVACALLAESTSLLELLDHICLVRHVADLSCELQDPHTVCLANTT